MELAEAEGGASRGWRVELAEAGGWTLLGLEGGAGAGGWGWS